MKRARVNLTYHFAVSMKSEDTQEDMVTVRTVIKGLRGDLTGSGRDPEIFYCARFPSLSIGSAL